MKDLDSAIATLARRIQAVDQSEHVGNVASLLAVATGLQTVALLLRLKAEAEADNKVTTESIHCGKSAIAPDWV